MIEYDDEKAYALFSKYVDSALALGKLNPDAPLYRNLVRAFFYKDEDEDEDEEPKNRKPSKPAIAKIPPSPFRGSKGLPGYFTKNVTTQFHDSLGRRVCMVNGERVDCPPKAETDDPTKERKKAGEDPKHPRPPGQGEQPVPRRLTLDNIEAQAPDTRVLIWTDSGGRAEVSSPDAWGKWARWVSSMKDAGELVRFASEGWSDNPGGILADFTNIDAKSDEPDVDLVTEKVLEALQNQPDAHIAIVTVADEAQRHKPQAPKVEKSPYGKGKK